MHVLTRCLVVFTVSIFISSIIPTVHLNLLDIMDKAKEKDLLSAGGRHDLLYTSQTTESGQMKAHKHKHVNHLREYSVKDQSELLVSSNMTNTDVDRTFTDKKHDAIDINAHAYVHNQSIINEDEPKDKKCTVKIDRRSINYFRSRLQIDDPNFIRFKIVFGDKNVSYTKETLHAFNWVWTYNSTNGIYPYIHWNVDYGILSFKLLDVKTLDRDPYIAFNISNCNLTIGSPKTNELLAEQYKQLVSELSENSSTITKYQESYFCYMAEAPGFRNTLGYVMGLYFVYPISVINYDCCYTYYNYSETRYEYGCMDKQMDKWIQCTIGPYILGVILFLYFPFILLKAAAWSVSNHISETSRNDDEDQNERTPLLQDRGKTAPGQDDDGWLYLDGKFPKSFMKLCASLGPSQIPVAVSRFKRFLFVLLGPSIIYLQMWLYSSQNDTMRKITSDIIAKGVPVGFLSLLGDKFGERRAAFVPAFGGPDVLLTSYYVLGLLFLVFPRSVQDVIENGIPSNRANISPLFLDAKEIRKLSKVHVSNKRGYGSATNLFLCSFYMLFTGSFWRKVFEIQVSRIKDSPCLRLRACKCAMLFLLPPYLVLCLIEIIVCIVYYSIPICSSVVMIVRGAVRTMANTIHNSVQSTNRSVFVVLLRSRLVIALCSLVVASMFIFYVYSFSLVFIQSFFFLSQILVYCYVAVLVYPAVSFGYIFFGVVLLYYIFRLIRGFGVKYLELLNDIMEIMLLMEERDNYSSVADGILVIRNVKLTRFRAIKINDAEVPMAQNVLQGLNENCLNREEARLNYKNNAYGIRKDLFDYIVTRHLPVHQQVLKVVFHLSMIILGLVITMSITAGFVTGPTSEMSEVMHVIFIITVGALPRVLEVAMHDSSEHIHRDIKLRRLEDTINQYWLDEAMREGGIVSSFHHVQVENELPELPP